MYKKFCKASKAGILAYEEVRKPQKAFVLGTTSRGMFLRTVSNRIIFLSMETYCGPLTVLLEGDNDCLGEITSGNWVNIQQDGIIFPGTRKMIHLENIKIWEMDNPEDTITFDSYLIKARLINISKGVYVSKGTQGFSTFLPYLLDFQGEPLTREDQNVFELILKVKSLLKANNGDGIVETLSQLIGLGRGLTPSGDDFSMGLFAALSR